MSNWLTTSSLMTRTPPRGKASTSTSGRLAYCTSLAANCCPASVRSWKITFYSIMPVCLCSGRLSFRLRLLLRLRSFADFNPTTSLLSFRSRHCYFKHAITESRVGLLRVDAGGQWYRPVKAAVASFGAIIALFVLFPFLLPFAANHDRIVTHIHVDIVF